MPHMIVIFVFLGCLEHTDQVTAINRLPQKPPQCPFSSSYIRLLVRKFLIDHLQKRGIPTYLWVLNDKEDFQRAFDLGASGVMTDRPTLLTEFLKEHPQLGNMSEQK